VVGGVFDPDRKEQRYQWQDGTLAAEIAANLQLGILNPSIVLVTEKGVKIQKYTEPEDRRGITIYFT
jgi:hypothetical protein